MSTNEILTGLGLIVVLAIGCRLVAERFRIPAIVLLLPAGFIAGALTDDVNPQNLFGDTYQPLVSLGVGLILFEAGLRLRLRDLTKLRSVVLRLISIGTLLTLASVTLAVYLVFGISLGISAMLGAILVVSGPTVVLPLLERRSCRSSSSRSSAPCCSTDSHPDRSADARRRGDRSTGCSHTRWTFMGEGDSRSTGACGDDRPPAQRRGRGASGGS
jgi:Kef-type K+ transport system membrane component KefB